jgi:hypothetical protein
MGKKTTLRIKASVWVVAGVRGMSLIIMRKIAKKLLISALSVAPFLFFILLAFTKLPTHSQPPPLHTTPPNHPAEKLLNPFPYNFFPCPEAPLNLFPYAPCPCCGTPLQPFLYDMCPCSALTPYLT